MAPEREYARRPCRRFVRFTAVVFNGGRLKFMELTGKAVNISANGFCFLTRYPLKPGSVLDLKSRWISRSQAVVMWVKRRGGYYMTGAGLLKEDIID